MSDKNITAHVDTIEISPEMIREGCRVLADCEADDDLELIAITVYEAMARVARSS